MFHINEMMGLRYILTSANHSQKRKLINSSISIVYVDRCGGVYFFSSSLITILVLE